MVSLEDIKRLLQQEEDPPQDVVDFFNLEPDRDKETRRNQTTWSEFWKWMTGQ